MKAIKIIGFIVSILALIYYAYQLFGNPNGKTYEVDNKHKIFYEGDGVTKEDAKKTGDYLKQIGLFTDNEADVQIKAEKQTDNVTVSFVVSKDKITPELEKSLLDIGGGLNAAVFSGRKVSVTIADNSMDEIKNLGYSQTPTQQNDQGETKQTDDAK